MFVFKARVLLFHFIVAVEWSEVSGDSFKKGERLAIMHKKVNFTFIMVFNPICGQETVGRIEQSKQCCAFNDMLLETTQVCGFTAA